MQNNPGQNIPGLEVAVITNQNELSIKKEYDQRNDKLSSTLNRNNSNPNPRVYPKRIKRCTMSLYGNRPGYGVQSLHRDLWE